MASDVFAPSEDGGRRALELIDAVIAKRPEKDDHALAAAVDSLCAWRKAWLGRRDAGAWDATSERRLGALNGVLSLVLAIHFPLGDVRWHELEGARTVLADLLEQPAAAA